MNHRTSMNNKIYLHGEVNEEMFERFSREVDQIEPGQAVLIEISSEGGLHYSSLAISDKMRSIDNYVIVQAIGPVMSAAVLILASGDERHMSHNSWAMVHEDSGKLSGSVTELEKSAIQLRKEELQWCELMEDLTGKPASLWQQLSEHTTYLTPKECQELNLIEHIGVYNGK